MLPAAPVPGARTDEVPHLEPLSEPSILRVDAALVARAAPLFDAYRRFYGQASDLAAAERFLAERVARDESAIFLACDGALGAGFMQLYPAFTSVGLARIWILNDLFVAPEARGRGIARTLLETARRHARATGARRVDLATAVTNARAQAVYEKFGFERNEGFRQYSLRV